MKETIMNQEKLAKLQAQVRIGGKVGIASSPCLLACETVCLCPRAGPGTRGPESLGGEQS